MKLLCYGLRGRSCEGYSISTGTCGTCHLVWRTLVGRRCCPIHLRHLVQSIRRRCRKWQGHRAWARALGGSARSSALGSIMGSTPLSQTWRSLPTPLFLKPTSAIIGPNSDVQIHFGSEKTDWEVELAVVISMPGGRTSCCTCTSCTTLRWRRPGTPRSACSSVAKMVHRT
jgi:hypothetical protein